MCWELVAVLPPMLLGVLAVLKARVRMMMAATTVRTATVTTAWPVVTDAGSSLRSATDGSGVLMAGTLRRRSPCPQTVPAVGTVREPPRRCGQNRGFRQAAPVSQALPRVHRVLLAPTCPLCGAAARALCPPCARTLCPAPELPPPAGTDACLALLAYAGAGRELVARLKYRNRRAVLPGLAAAMASLVPEEAIPDVVTWVPTTPARRRRRGFDQSELLARAVARRLRRPCARLLVRGAGPPQTGRGLVERRRGPALDARRPAPARVLLVDDVVTTGSTAAAGARALRRAGASSVTVLAAARTPRRPPGPRRSAAVPATTAGVCGP
jgi:ComF family protein